MNDADTIVSGLGIIDVFIGLAFIYFSLSIIGSSILESLVSLVRYRARFLRKAIHSLVDEPDDQAGGELFAVKLLSHPMVAKQALPLSSFKRNIKLISEGPSYLSGSVFSEALVDILKNRVQAPNKVKNLHEGISSLAPNSSLRDLLQPMLDRSNNESDFIWRLTTWYDNYMDRMSGSYKRHTQGFLFLIGLVLAVSLNINSVEYAVRLSCDGPFREMLVGEALTTLEQHPSTEVTPPQTPSRQNNGIISVETQQKIVALQSRLAQHSVDAVASQVTPPLTPEALRCLQQTKGIGQSPTPQTAFLYYSGFILTALAVSLGSAFWLNLLRMMASIRSSMQITRPSSQKPEVSATSGEVNSVPQVVNFEVYLDSVKIEVLQAMLGLQGTQITGTWSIATRDAIDNWRKQTNIPITGPLIFDEYLKIMNL